MVADWEPGRRLTPGKPSYLKKLVWLLMTPWFSCDVYKLIYPKGSSIPVHTDKIEGKSHWRLNLVYKNCVSGGEFWCPTALLNWSRIKLFRSDLEHSVSEIIEEERRVLSLGVCF